MKARILSVVLRGGGLAGKFLLFFVLARVLPAEDLGLFGLLSAAISYSLFALGMDFYAYSSREMAGSTRDDWPAILRDQSAFFACTYLLVFPLLFLLFVFGVLPWQHCLAFYILLFLEHASQELLRLMVVSHRPLLAAALLFLRSGSWGLLIALIAGLSLFSVDLGVVLWLWGSADLCVLLIACWALRSLPWAKRPKQVDWRWIQRGLKVAGVFIVGTFALRGIFTFDRFLVEHFASLQMVGVYTLFFGIANSLQGFVDAAVFSFRYPKLIEIHRNGSAPEFQQAMREFAKQTLGVVAVLSALCALLVVPVLIWIGKPIYLDNVHIFYILLAGVAVFVISHIPHYSLYAMAQDRVLLKAHLLGFGFFVVSGWILARELQTLGVAIALLLASALMGAYKQWKVHALTLNPKTSLT